jgi:hypothetical protein
MFRVAIYARTGSDDGPRDLPMDRQLELCRAYTWRHGYALVQEAQDHDIDERTLNRPGLVALRQLIAEAQIDGVVVASLDRLARDPIHRLVLWAEYARADVEIISVSQRQGGDIEPKDFMMGIHSALEIQHQFMPAQQHQEPHSTPHSEPSTTYRSTPSGRPHEISAAQAALVRQMIAWTMGRDGGEMLLTPEQIRERLRVMMTDER